ncbi:MAG: Clp protease ClpP [Defluviimonas sp.]|nr:Clp protease ClpP [Defluviimonas sp.]
MTNRPTFRIDGYIGNWPNTAQALAEFLAAHPRRDVDVITNSPGGDAFEGAAILAEAEAHGRVRFRVRGVAASSASLLLCGGASVLMHPAAFWMAHRPWSALAGDAEVHRAEAELLEKVGRSDAEVYSRFSGHPVPRVQAWLAAETWLSAEEAVALGFADGLDGEAPPEAPAAADYTKYAAAPAALQRLARENGWAAVPSEPKGGEQ